MILNVFIKMKRIKNRLSGFDEQPIFKLVFYFKFISLLTYGLPSQESC